jgi:hypothetical protein
MLARSVAKRYGACPSPLYLSHSPLILTMGKQLYFTSSSTYQSGVMQEQVRILPFGADKCGFFVPRDVATPGTKICAVPQLHFFPLE